MAWGEVERGGVEWCCAPWALGLCAWLPDHAWSVNQPCARLQEYKESSSNVEPVAPSRAPLHHSPINNPQSILGAHNNIINSLRTKKDGGWITPVLMVLTLLAPHSHMWGQITLTVSSLSPKREWGPKRVNSRISYLVRVLNTVLIVTFQKRMFT